MRKTEKMEFDTEDEQIATLLIAEPNTTDLQGQQVSKEVIREMQQSYNNFKHWGIQHMDKNLRLYDLPNMDQSEVWQSSYDDDIELLDSFILSSDSVINGQQIKEGSWIANIHLRNPAIWQKMKNEELTGVSVGGLASSVSVNSHSQILAAIIGELSLCNKAASNKRFLMLKGMDLWLRPYPNFHSCAVRDKGSFQPESFRTIESRTGKTNLIIGRLKGETSTTIQSIRYPISRYSESVARQNCQRHKGSFEPAKEK